VVSKPKRDGKFQGSNCQNQGGVRTSANKIIDTSGIRKSRLINSLTMKQIVSLTEAEPFVVELRSDINFLILLCAICQGCGNVKRKRKKTMKINLKYLY
jgi:hypothetical protein